MGRLPPSICYLYHPHFIVLFSCNERIQVSDPEHHLLVCRLFGTLWMIANRGSIYFKRDWYDLSPSSTVNPSSLHLPAPVLRIHAAVMLFASVVLCAFVLFQDFVAFVLAMPAPTPVLAVQVAAHKRTTPYFPEYPPSCPKCQVEFDNINSCADASAALADPQSVSRKAVLQVCFIDSFCFRLFWTQLASTA
jgi:hypothetical protein